MVTLKPAAIHVDSYNDYLYNEDEGATNHGRRPPLPKTTRHRE